jgi:endoglucanase
MRLKLAATAFGCVVLFSLFVGAVEIKSIGLVSDKVLCLEAEDGTVDHRAGGKYGAVKGATFSSEAAENVDNYRVGSLGDPGYRTPLSPRAVGRKSVGTEFARVGDWDFRPRLTHCLYLDMPHPFRENVAYSIRIAGVLGARTVTARFTMDSTARISPAIHLSEIGYLRVCPKVAYLSCWSGSGGPLDLSAFEGRAFTVRQADSRRTVAFKGLIALRRNADTKGDDAYGKNFQRTDVYEMDFSLLREPGRYVLSVPGLGCSEVFPIGDTVFRAPYRVCVHGLYYQRCGCALPSQYAGRGWARKRCHHPRDRKSVHDTTLAIPQCSMGGGTLNQFKELPKRTTGKTLNYWGGWHDAGDFDRRAQHLEGAALLLDVYTIFPKRFADRDLPVPEAGNGVPDIIDEALWCVDFFARGMTSEGGVRGGIESDGHPEFDSCSWEDRLRLYAYAEDARTSYRFAWCAAKAARALDLSGHASRAAPYAKAAEKAWRWATTHDEGSFADAKNAAAAELLAITGGAEYDKAFRQTSVLSRDPNVGLKVWKKHDQTSGTFSFAVAVPADKTDADFLAIVRKAIVREGDKALKEVQQRAFRFAGDLYRPLNWGLGACPDVAHAIRAFAVTRETKYADAVATSCAFTLGGNPCNLVFVTGLGKRRITQVLDLDSWRLADARDAHDTVPGLVPSGPVAADKPGGGIRGFSLKSHHPDFRQWPSLELYAGNRFDPGQNEHTVNLVCDAAHAYAFLHAYGTRTE